MIAPIDRIEDVRAQVDDVERQMEACRIAGVQFSPTMTWQLLSACKSLLGATLKAEIRRAKAEALRDAAEWFDRRHPETGEGNGRAYNSYTVAAIIHNRADDIERGQG